MDFTSRNPQGYSDFFTSGLRAMTGRGRRRTKAKSVDLTHSAHHRSSFWTDECFELGQSSDPRRRASVIIGGSGTESPYLSSTKKRRSGLPSFPARWFSRAKEPDSSPSISPTTHDEDDALYADDEKEQGSSSIESPSLPSLHERSPLNPLYPIHPFSSSSDRGSTPFEPGDLSTFKIERRRESFLSLNSSSSNVSSFFFPAVPCSHPTFAEARSPISPLSPYTQSSSSWDREEEEDAEMEWEGMPMEASYTSEDQEACDWDAPAMIDWRQFHVHLLQIANDTTKL